MRRRADHCIEWEFCASQRTDREARRIAEMGFGRVRRQLGDDGGGCGEVFEREPGAVPVPGADDTNAFMACGVADDRPEVRQCARDDRPAGAERAEGAGTVRGHEDGRAVCHVRVGCFDRRVPEVEPIRREAADFAEEQCRFFRREYAGTVDIVRRDKPGEAAPEERRDRRGRAELVDEHVERGVDSARFGGEQCEVDFAGHGQSMTGRRAPGIRCIFSGMDARPVGLFDSGVGGLSVLRHFQHLAPNEHLLYFADTAYFPYGPRPAAEVRKRSFAIVQRLLQEDVKLIVVACNTASAAAIADLRAAFDVPFVGMVPGLKPAATASQRGRVAILATPGTLDGDLYSRVVEEFGRSTTITNVPGHGLADLVERGETGTPAARAAVRAALEPAIRDGADTVVLGCTHYHFLPEDIHAEFPDVALIDTSEPVARRAAQLLRELDMEAPANQQGRLDLIVSGDRETFRSTMAKLGFAASAVEEPA